MKLDERTTVPLFAILMTVPFALGGVLWLTSIDAKATRAQLLFDEQKPIVQKTYESVIRIEEQLKTKQRK